jgi:hypothetical protein
MSSITPTPRSYPFAIANAFTQDAFGGNPAAIVFLDPSNTLTQEERLKFAKGFNQPIIVFLTPTSTPTDKPGAVASFDVQYFGPSCELEVCGHGAIAAIKIILDSATNSPGFGEGSQFPTFSSPETHTVEFIAAKGTVVSARKVVIPHEASGKEEEWFEIVLPAGNSKSYPLKRKRGSLAYSTAQWGRNPKSSISGSENLPSNTTSSSS